MVSLAVFLSTGVPKYIIATKRVIYKYHCCIFLLSFERLIFAFEHIKKLLPPGNTIRDM